MAIRWLLLLLLAAVVAAMPPLVRAVAESPAALVNVRVYTGLSRFHPASDRERVKAQVLYCIDLYFGNQTFQLDVQHDHPKSAGEMPPLSIVYVRSSDHLSHFASLQPVANNKDVILLHGADEQCNHGSAVEAYGQALLVLRHYICAAYEAIANVVIVPIGPFVSRQYAAGYVPTDNSRRRLCNFYGVNRNDERRQLSLLLSSTAAASAVPLCDTRINQEWFSNDALPEERYLAELHDSAFTLAPGGNNPETHRFYEALDEGSVPIVVHYPFLKVLTCSDSKNARLQTEDRLPFPVLDTWEKELLPLLADMKAHPAKAAEMGAATTKWYQLYKQCLQRDLRRRLHLRTRKPEESTTIV